MQRKVGDIGGKDGAWLSRQQATGGDSDFYLRLIADNVRDFAIIVADTRQRIQRWSAGAEQILGWTEAEALGQNLKELIFTPEDKAAGAPDQEESLALREGRAEDERWHMHKDGRRFWGSGVMVPLYEPEKNTLCGFGKVLRDLTARKKLEDQLQQANETLEARVAERTAELKAALAERQALLQQIVQTQGQERRRISRELHDQTGQHLTGLALGLKTLDTPDVARNSMGLLTRLRTVTEELARDIHRIAVELRPTALDDLGLVPALDNYIGQWSVRTGIPVVFEPIRLDGQRLPELVETTVYRVVQEALTNIARYASDVRTQVSVTLLRFDGSLQAIVEDNGPGFDLDVARQSGRLGIAGMRERAISCGGTLEVETAPGQGTTVLLRVPVTQA